MNQSIYFDYKFTTLNEYINAERSNRYKAAAIKKRETYFVSTIVKSLLNRKTINKIDEQVDIEFVWHELNKKRDPSNIAFAKKFIEDGMVKAGLLENDGHKQIRKLSDRFIFTKVYGVEVILTSAGG